MEKLALLLQWQIKIVINIYNTQTWCGGASREVGEQDNNGAFCGLVLWCLQFAFKRSRKGNYPDI